MDQEQIRNDIKNIRGDLDSALKNLKKEAASKLSSKDWAEVERSLVSLMNYYNV
jgi:ribosome recycling factor